MGSDKRTCCLALIFLTIGLSGCGGRINANSRPVYPENWPALETSTVGKICPDISETYRAISEEPAPLVYPPGFHPRQLAFLAKNRKPFPILPLGRRILPWQLAGIQLYGDYYHQQHDNNQDLWNALERYSEDIEAETVQPGLNKKADWVRVLNLPDNRIEVNAGLHERTAVRFVLKKEFSIFTTTNLYACKDGGVMIYSGFLRPAVETVEGHNTAYATAFFTFYRTVDGSLVAFEEGTDWIFGKFWLWRRVE